MRGATVAALVASASTLLAAPAEPPPDQCGLAAGQLRAPDRSRSVVAVSTSKVSGSTATP